MTRTIDAHHHYWKTAAQDQPWRQDSHAGLARDFGPADLAPELALAGIQSTILVQSVDESAENDRLSEYARHPTVAGVVAWLPIADADSAFHELERMDPYKVCGVRTLIAQDPLEWLLSEKTLTVFREISSRSLAWDVVPVTGAQISAVVRLAEAVPELRIVVDHLGRPPVESGQWEPWASNLQQLAACPGVAMKVSVGLDVLSKWDTWRAEDLLPYIQWAAENFGPSRLMLASNWPVVLLKTDYQRAWSDLHTAVHSLFTQPEDVGRLKGGTATEWYSL